MNRGTEEIWKYYREFYDSGVFQKQELQYENEYLYAEAVVFFGITFKI